MAEKRTQKNKDKLKSDVKINKETIDYKKEDLKKKEQTLNQNEQKQFQNTPKKNNKTNIIYLLILLLFISLSLLFAQDLEDLIVNEEFLKSSSLFGLSFIIGLIDGFNPCAMWVLIYLITLVAELKDKKKMWLIAGTFLLASGVIYFVILSLYLAGWELAIFMGYSSIVMTIAGIFALVSGAYFLNDFIKSGGKVVCNIGDMKKRSMTMNKIKDIVHSPFTIPTFIGLVFLAFSVNLTEFFCSIGLPQVFTNIISVAEITNSMQFVYIFIYIIAFMADDLLIFFLALKALDTPVMDKYSGLAKLIGGVLMIVLGIILLFFPQLLM